MPAVACFVAAPITAFRAPRAREYFETLLLPPPATVYGMLLSAVGETDRRVQEGAELAVAIIRPGTRTRVLRTMWRVKNVGEIPEHGGLRYGPGQNPEDFGVQDRRGGNRRPDFQELLVDVRFAVHVRAGPSEASPSLAERVETALGDPALIRRFGGLALGESTHLLDELRRLRAQDGDGGALWLVRDPNGPHALPVWPDHVGSEGTHYQQFGVQATTDLFTPPEEAWVSVAPREG